MLFRLFVQQLPRDHPDEANGANDAEGRMPAPLGGDPWHAKRRQHGADIGARIEHAGGERALALGEVFGGGLDRGGVIYNRNVCKLNAASLLKLADRCPNLIGFKDGVGEIDTMVTIRRKLGDRFTYLGGLPTAEVYAEAYKALGVPVYSSAVFNFIPKTAIAFYEAVRTNDTATTGRLIDSFFLPYLDIRNKQAGYAVSIVKAGATLVGHSAGPVRTPLTDLNAQECEELDVLIKALGPQ